MKKIGLFLANGFEEIEALCVVDLCRRANILVEMISIEEDRIVEGSHQIKVISDKLFEEVKFEELDMLVLPGGMPGTKNLETHLGLMEQIDIFYQKEKYIGAICAAPSILGNKGMLKNKNACSYPSFESYLEGAIVTENNVEKCGKIITSRGMGTAFDFGLAIVKEFCGEEIAENLRKTIVYHV